MDDTSAVDTGESFEKLVDVVAYLRSDEGCPWDREQTMQSMVEHLREETEEVVDAVESGDMENLEEELGDLILQGVFYAQMASEESVFSIADVLERLNQKLIRRHPHVFGDETADNPSEAIDRWNEVKNNN